MAAAGGPQLAGWAVLRGWARGLGGAAGGRGGPGPRAGAGLRGAGGGGGGAALAAARGGGATGGALWGAEGARAGGRVAGGAALAGAAGGRRGFAAGGGGRPREEQGQAAGAGEHGEEEQPAGEEEAPGPQAENEQVAAEPDAERVALEKELDDTKDALLRVLADMENLRGRTAKQVEASQKFAVQGLVKSLLDVSDNLDRALGAVPSDMLAPTLGEEDVARAPEMLRSLHEGVQMTGQGLQQAFKQNKVEKYEPSEGDEFDPNLHNALFEIPAPEGQTVGRIAVVTKPGFTLHDRVLRPAEVGVFK